MQNQAGVERGVGRVELMGGEGGGGRGGGFKLDKSAPKGKSRQDKDKTDSSTTTNKQDPQDTPAD